MGTKKKKNRRQKEPNDSSDSCDENHSTTKVQICNHATKSVCFSKVKKEIFSFVNSERSCTQCLLPSTENGDVWLCLQCGNGPHCKNHNSQHYLTPSSDSHSLTVNIHDWSIWCYKCNKEVPANSPKKLMECVEFLKRHLPGVKNKNIIKVAASEGYIDSIIKPLSDVTNTHKISPKRKVLSAGDLEVIASLPKVRGLRNLGNTCFFNAVLQCLARTPFLLPVLEEMKEPGYPFFLPGENSEKLPPFDHKLGKWGSLTEELAKLLKTLQSPETEVVNPQGLLNKLTQTCPQFAGGDQHDAHELLRHLLESVRTEDLKRYQTCILNHCGLSTKTDPKDVPSDMKEKVRAYGKQAEELLLYPEQVFRGSLVSTLECQVCGHSSRRFETFLDLSLPVMADKPQPPVARRKAHNDDVSENNLSKHQQRKRKMQKISGKNRVLSAQYSESPNAIAEETRNSKSFIDTVQSDAEGADVEDNIDVESSMTKSVDIVESGYSSEKAVNDGSDSPSSAIGHENDSVLASPNIAIPLPPLPSLEVTNITAEMNVNNLNSLSSEINLTPENTFHCTKQCVSPETQESKFDICCNKSSYQDSLCHVLDMLMTPDKFQSNFPSDGIHKSSSVEVLYQDETDQDGCATDRDLKSEVPDSSYFELKNEYCIDEEISAVANCLDSMYRNGENFQEIQSESDSWPSDFQPLLDDDDKQKEKSVHAVSPNLQDSDSINSSSEQKTSSFQMLGESVNVKLENMNLKSVTDSEYDDKENIPQGNVSFMQPQPVSNDFSQTNHTSLTQEEISEKRSEDLINENDCENGIDYSVNESSDIAVSNLTLAPRYHCEPGDCSIQSCLNQFTAIELMTGNNKVGCENCTERFNKGKEGKMVCTNSTKQFLVNSPPAVLILHLKRFQLLRSSFRKMCRHVSFPLSLDIAPICSTMCKDLPILSPGQTEVIYSLYGVVEHSGNLHGGHYVAYVKVRPLLSSTDSCWSFLPDHSRRLIKTELAAGNLSSPEPPPGKWYFVSDTMVKEVDEQRVLQSQAYLLFYERIK